MLAVGRECGASSVYREFLFQYDAVGGDVDDYGLTALLAPKIECAAEADFSAGVEGDPLAVGGDAGYGECLQAVRRSGQRIIFAIGVGDEQRDLLSFGMAQLN